MAVNIKKEFGSTRKRNTDVSTLVYGKIQPQEPEIEAAVLGAILLEKEKQEEVLDILTSPDMFYVDAHQKIFAAIIDMDKRAAEIDLLTVTHELRKREELEIVGGPYFLTNLTQGIVSSAHVERHATIIKEKYISREIIRLCGNTINDAYNGSDALEVLEQLQRDTDLIASDTITKQAVPISTAVAEVMMDLEEERLQEHEFNGIPTGSKKMDQITGGWQKGSVFVLAARPGVGKTAYALNLLYEAATNPIMPYPVLFLSLEMKRNDIIKRLISIASGIDNDKLRFPKRWEPGDEERIFEHAQKLAGLTIEIDDDTNLSSRELKAKVRKFKKKHGTFLCIIDYLQLMSGDSEKSWNREAEIAKISRDVKKIAMYFEIPVIELCQLNRSVEGRASKTYKLSDLRESGAIEQDADMVMFLHKPESEDMKSEDKRLHTAGVFVEKWRNGGKGKVPYLANEKNFQWKEVDENNISYIRPPKQTASTNTNTSSFTPMPENEDDLPF